MQHSNPPRGKLITLPPTLRFMMGVEQAPAIAIDAMLEQAIAEYDAIEGDPDLEDSTDAEDEFVLSEAALDYGRWKGAGCPISDPGGGAVDDEGEGIDEREGEQMFDDVPMLAVRTLEGEFVGFSNMMSSYNTNGTEVRSADTGEMLMTRGWAKEPGAPV